MHFGAYKGKTSTEVREEESKSRLWIKMISVLPGGPEGRGSSDPGNHGDFSFYWWHMKVYNET
jgi:hypothetical protein